MQGSSQSKPQHNTRKQQQQGRRPRSGSSSSRPVVGQDHPGWAKQVWFWCQQEGAALEKYSQGEVKELLEAGEESLPVELAQLIKKRCVFATNASCVHCTIVRQSTGSIIFMGWYGVVWVLLLKSTVRVE
jgi:hypothetical protein